MIMEILRLLNTISPFVTMTLLVRRIINEQYKKRTIPRRP